MRCTFFGHRKTPPYAEKLLLETVVNLIECSNTDTFYVGNQGDFDYMAIKTLKGLKEIYPHITFNVVLSYLPTLNNNKDKYDNIETIYPEGLENIPKKFAIAQRNRWMIEHSDVVIVFVKNSIGGAYKFKSYAEQKGKIVINLADITNPPTVF